MNLHRIVGTLGIMLGAFLLQHDLRVVGNFALGMGIAYLAAALVKTWKEPAP